MPAPTIAALPTVPSRSSVPETFTSDMDTFLAALPTLRTEINSFGTYMDGLAVGNPGTGIFNAFEASGNGTVGDPAIRIDASGADWGFRYVSDNNGFLCSGGVDRIQLGSVGVLVPNGAVGTPSLGFNGDPDTGLYSIGTNRLGIATSGTKAIEVSASQQVGIGAVPSSLLHLREDNASGLGADIIVENNAAGAGTEVGLYLAPNTGGIIRAASVVSRQPTSGTRADLGFFTANGATPVERMTISVTGEVHVIGDFALTDGITAPSTVSGKAFIYVDTADGDLKVKFGDGTVKTLATDT